MQDPERIYRPLTMAFTALACRERNGRRAPSWRNPWLQRIDELLDRCDSLRAFSPGDQVEVVDATASRNGLPYLGRRGIVVECLPSAMVRLALEGDPWEPFAITASALEKA